MDFSRSLLKNEVYENTSEAGPSALTDGDENFEEEVSGILKFLGALADGKGIGSSDVGNVNNNNNKNDDDDARNGKSSKKQDNNEVCTSNRKRSKYYIFFTANGTQCKFCKYRTATRLTASNAKRHVERQHRRQLECFDEFFAQNTPLAVDATPKKMYSTSYKGVSIPDGFEYDINHFMVPKCYEGDLSSIIIPEGLINDRLKQLAHEIHSIVGDQHMIMLCVLKGSYRFFTNLVDQLSMVRNSCKTTLQVEFIKVKSYQNTESTGKLQITGLSNLTELKGKNVLVVDDIIDSGVTLSQLVNTLKSLEVCQVWTSLLLSKRVPRKAKADEHFVAFNIPDKFIVGHGLDYNQVFRDLNHICVMSDQGIEKYRHHN